MKRLIMRTATCVLVAVSALAATGAHAQTAWRTPPVKNTGATETVSCDLLNNSGHDILISNLTIRVQTLDGGISSTVVHTPGPMLMADGRGIRGSSPAGMMPFRTVYCEVDLASSISVGDDGLMFTMTFDDGTRKAVTTAPPRPPRIAR